MAHGQASTATTLVVSELTLTHGTPLTFTATVTAGATQVHPGTVTICDTSFALCSGAAVVGTAQLTSSGRASFKILPAIGTHTYKAVFAGTADYASSTSSYRSVTVTGTAATAATISSKGSAGNYTLTGRVATRGGLLLSPTGTVSFQDASNGNYILGSSPLTSGAPRQTLVSAGGSSGVGSGNGRAVAADFNGDGIPDLAVPAADPANISILLGRGNGTFTASGSPIALPGNEVMAAAGDFNSDGNLDLVTCNWGDASLSILLGNGDGTFQSPIRIAGFDKPTAVAVGDFNRDGNLDLAITSQGSSKLIVLLGDGAGGFTIGNSYDTGSQSNSVVAVDLNGDGSLDLAIGNSNAGSVSVFLGNGAGAFSQPSGSPFAAGSGPWTIAAADLNGDGRMDLVTANANDSTFSVLIGNGDGTFARFVPYAVSSPGQNSVAVADFNQDGIPDLALCYATDHIGLFLGNGDGTFQREYLYPAASTGCASLVAADFNGDGLPDLAANFQGNNTAAVLLDGLAQTASLASVSIPGNGAHEVTAAYSGDSNNAASTSSSIPLAASRAAISLNLQASPSTTRPGQQTTLTATLSPYALGSLTTNGETVTFKNAGIPIGTDRLSSGVATLNFSSMPASINRLTAVYAGDTNFLGASSGILNYPVGDGSAQDVVAEDSDAAAFPGPDRWHAAAAAVTAPTTNTGSTSATQTATVTIATAGTLNSIQVLTQGATGLDYAFVGGGTCSAGTVYSVGQACTVEYTFAPVAPGQRNGAIVLTSSAPAVLGTSYIAGMGTGPALGFPPGIISTIAGTGPESFSGDGGLATSAMLGAPRDATMDASGNIYIADAGNLRIRKIAASTGIITTVAGNGTYGYSGDGGAATSASLSAIEGVAVDGAGNIFIADSYNYVIREINAVTGIISTVAGNGTQGYAGDGAAATAAEFVLPVGVVVDGAGNLYIGDYGNDRVRKVTAATGIISTVAGNGSGGYNGDGELATSANINNPKKVAVDSAGDIYIGDCGNRVRLVSASTGIISTVAGTGVQGYSGDGGPATSAELSGSCEVALDTAGNLYISDTGNNAIRVVNAATGIISTLAGNGAAGYAGDAGVATGAELSSNLGIAVDGKGNLYIADFGNNRIREVNVSSPPSESFASTAVGATSPDVDQSVENTGNATLTISGFSIPAGVLLDGASTTCSTGSQVLAPATGCLLAMEFAPATAGPFNSDLILTENALNIANSTQMLPLSGTAIKGTPSITWATPAAISYGTTLSATQLDASSTVAGTFAYAPAAGSILSAGTQTLSALFTPTDSADYNTATRSVSLVVNQGAPTIVFSVAAKVYGAAPFTVSATSNSTGAFTYSVVSGPATVSGSTVTLTGVGPVELQASQAATTNYTSGTQTASFSVAPMPFSLLPATIQVFAGQSGTSGYSGDGGLATAATLSSPSSAAIDRAGNLYVADSNNNVVRKITPAGYISTYAGTGTAGSSGDGGAATSAELYHPKGLAIDSSGNLYIADSKNSVVRKVTPAGVISLYAGSYVSNYSGDGGAATSATLASPYGLAMDSNSNLYICDTSNNVIRQVTSAGIISTVAGNHIAGYSGDTGAATSAELSAPKGAAVDAGGNLYIADTANNRIRMVNTGGVISTFAGNGAGADSGDGGAPTSAGIYDPQNLTVDSAGNIYIGEPARLRWVSAGGVIQTLAGNGTSGSTGSGGAATAAEIGTITGAVVGASGQLYLSDNSFSVIRLLTLNTGFPSTGVGQSSAVQALGIVLNSAGAIQNIAVPSGFADFSVGSITGCTVDGVTVNAAGTVCSVPVTFTPQYAGLRSAPLAVTAGGTKYAFGLSGIGSGAQLGFEPGIISTFAGTGTSGYSGDGGAATLAKVSSPTSVAVAADGSTYISDYIGCVIRKVSRGGVISTIAGNGTCSFSGDGGLATSATVKFPEGLALDSAGNLYIVDNGDCRVRKIDGNGIISTVIGTGTCSSGGDGGLATAASLQNPNDVALDGLGNLYISDGAAGRIRIVYPSGYIATFAGTGTEGFSGDGGPATSAEVNVPYGIAADSAGNIYFADAYNNRIRAVNRQGIVNTIAGIGNAGYTGDGGAASGAELNLPSGLALDPANNIYFSDNGNEAVRRIDGNGIITTVAGTGTAGYSGDGGAAPLGKLNIYNAGSPWLSVMGVAAGNNGALLIPDMNNSRVRAVNSGQTVPLTFPPTTDDTAIGSDLAAINSGGPQVGNFSGDEDFINGATSSTTNTVSTAGVANAAPAAVYQSERFGGFSYAIPGLTPGTSYLVRLHFAEIYWTQVGQRIFNVTINGAPALTNFDIVAAAGGPNIAVVEQFLATADNSGQISVGFPSALVDLPKISGIEIATVNSSAASAAQSVTVLNQGNANLSFSSLTASTGYQIVGGTCGKSSAVIAGQTCTVGVVFAPTGGAGVATGTVTLTDNTPQSPHTIGVSGVSTLQSAACSIGASPSVSAYGSPVTLTATISPATGGMPTGAVTFLDGTATLGVAALNGSAAATLNLTTLSVGSHSITASYAGDSAFSSCVSAAASEVVSRAAATATLQSSLNPSIYGDSVTLTVLIAGGGAVPTGTATLMDGATTLATLTLDGTGTATYTSRSLAAGSHALQVTYGGDGNYY